MSAFRDQHGWFTGAGAQVLGVSMDTVETQTKFASSLSAPFPLLADVDGAVSKAYGVWNAEGNASRVTFVIGKDGRIVDVFQGKDALDPAGALGACKRSGPP
jgi:thioredoxin-dependent peroxiredoxin